MRSLLPCTLRLYFLFDRQGEFHETLLAILSGFDLNRFHLNACCIDTGLLDQIGAHLFGSALGEFLQVFVIDSWVGNWLRRRFIRGRRSNTGLGFT